MAQYIVQSAAAKMPSKCKGRYARVAVLEVADGVERVAMISERARGVLRIVRTWEKRNVGKTERGAYQRAVADAEALALKLNAKAGRVALRAFDPSI